MRATLVTETFPPDINGVAATLGQLTEGLLAAGHRVQLVRPRNGVDGERALPEGMSELLVGGVRLPWYREVHLGLPVTHRLAEAWEAERPDVVHIATEGPLGWAALRAARKLGVTVTSSLHTNFHAYASYYGIAWLGQPVMGYLRRFHRQTALTLIPTRHQRDQLMAQGFPELTVMGRGVDHYLFAPGRRDPALRSRWGAGESDLVACYVGRLAPEKSLDVFVRAVRAMQAVDPGVRGVVVGDGPERARLEQQEPDLVFCGAQRGESLARHYASADVFVFPSETETYGIVVLEAMASGLAVVCYDYAAGEELIRDGENGCLVPFGDSEALVAAAAGLAGDRERVARLGRAAVAEAAGHSWTAVRERFTELLERHVEARRERRA